MIRLAYDTDLTNDQWQILESLIPAAKHGGRPRSLDMREILNAIFYLLANGIKWRAMPHDLPRWQSVYTYFRAWEADGTWQRLNDELRVMVRLQAGRNAQPSDGAGRSDHAAMKLLATFSAQFWTFLKVIWIDSTFAGKDFIAQIAQDFGWQLEHLKRTDENPGFTVIPKRWVVERTYSWFGHYRRLSKDYEFLPTTSEMMIFAAMVHLMVRRLKPKHQTW